MELTRYAVIAGTAAGGAAGLVAWWAAWPLAFVVLSGMMFVEDREVVRYVGGKHTAALLQAAGLFEQGVIATLATGVGLLARTISAIVA